MYTLSQYSGSGFFPVGKARLGQRLGCPSHRKSAIVAAAALIVVHVGMLAASYGTPVASLWGDWIGAIAGFVGGPGRWSASRRSGLLYGKRVWRLVSFSSFSSSLDQFAYTYYFDYHHAPSGALLAERHPGVFLGCPAMMTLFLSPRDPGSGFRWLRLCDFVQVCTLVLALELSTLYIPSRWQSPKQPWLVRVFYAGCPFFGSWLSLSVRGLLTPLHTARAFFFRLAAFFFVFGVTSNITRSLCHRNLSAGDLARSAVDPYYCLPDGDCRDLGRPRAAVPESVEPQSAHGLQLLTQFSPLLIPAIVFPLVLGSRRSSSSGPLSW